jgi:diguanylate cyclase (GGDEF)-like protein
VTVQDDPAAARSTAAPSRHRDPRRRKAFLGPGAVTIRPLSDPGVLSRLAPFAGAGIIAVVLASLPPTSPNATDLAAAAVLLTVLVSAALLIPWARLPDWSQASPPLIGFAFIALLRQAEGGATSAFAPVVMLPVLWLAIYGTRVQFRLAIAATAATFLGPLLLVGAPLYPTDGWREAAIWVSLGLLAGSATQALVDQSRRRTADVAALGVITRALTTGSDPRPELCAAAKVVTGSAFVVLMEPEDDGTLVATAGTNGIDLGSLRIDPAAEVSASAEAWRTGTRIYIADVASDPRASARLAEHTGAVSVLFHPVVRDGRRTAVLVVGFYESRREVPEPEMFLVDLLGAEIGAAIDRADLVALLATQSRIDPLTGAANRRSWDEEMDRELARARRTGAPLTVAILDMDQFKIYNDAFGHLAGDVLLKDLVTAVRAELRTGDIIARWGGEEFAIALPDCDVQQAHALASRLLNVVPSGQTASIGLTQARTHDHPRDLIDRADQALYAAKKDGRNQVKTYQSPPALGLVQIQNR